MNSEKELYLYNTLTGQKDKFIPLNNKNVRMYACGPTVYDFAHLGNARAAVVYDVLYRVLCVLYGKGFVKYVRNITDVDDKIIARAKEREISIDSLSKEFTEHFHKDMESLNVLEPTIEPKATDNIDEIIKVIQKLIDNGNAYVSQGHVLFDVHSYKDYGKLSNRTLDELVSGARVEVADYKRNPLDFVLWKPADEDDNESAIFDSPWSRGRPGWHIECSAMSTKFLGESYDIHGGGVDLKFPHHENEIAQSTCAYRGSSYARYWVHNGFLMVNGEKMSKSLGNFITVRDLIDKDIKGIVIRYVMLSTHYRKPLDFSEKNISDAEIVLKKSYKTLDDSEVNASVKTEVENDLLDALCDDLNTPVAISILHKYKSEKKSTHLKCALETLGLYDESFLESEDNIIDEQKIIATTGLSIQDIKNKIQERLDAKKAKDWAVADSIRNELSDLGIILKDTVNGSDWEINF